MLQRRWEREACKLLRTARRTASHCRVLDELALIPTLRESRAFCFFFSSRRRHTRCSRDWSSDVCSSDLAPMAVRRIRLLGDPILRVRCERVQNPKSAATRLLADDLRDTLRVAKEKHKMEIGRASCRERV